MRKMAVVGAQVALGFWELRSRAAMAALSAAPMRFWRSMERPQWRCSAPMMATT